VIEAQKDEQVWRVCRRFSEFEQLKKEVSVNLLQLRPLFDLFILFQLEAAFTTLGFPPLPMKNFKFFWNMDASLVEERKQKLEEYE
jgi:hypothetical protein